MGGDELVGLDCQPGTIAALQSGLEQFGGLETAEWLISAVWLKASDCDLLATSFTNVLSDGYIARPLSIARADDFARQLRTELPDVGARLASRQTGGQLPDPARPEPPARLKHRPPGLYQLDVLIRIARRASCTHRIACALRFEFAAGGSLLVGTDSATLAMVLSEDPKVVARYSAACEVIPAADYLDRYRG